MRRILLLTIFLLNLPLLIQAQYNSYPEAEKVVLELENRGRYQEAIDILESINAKFPDYQYDLERELVYLYKQTGQFEKCPDVWKAGHKRGCYYFINLRSPRFEDFADLKGIREIELRDLELREQDNQNSQTIYKIQVPENYSPEIKYPLLIVLHGGGNSIERAQANWESPLLAKSYITAYVQSYLHFEMDTYGWPVGDARVDDDLLNIYDEIVTQFSIDQSHVIIGGISNGGSCSLHLALNNILPITGFIGVCPGQPGDFSEEMAQAAAGRGLRGYILCGQNDPLLERQQNLSKSLKNAGLKHEFVIIEGLGHNYPRNFAERLDTALQYLNTR